MENIDAFITVVGAMTTLYSVGFASLHGKFSDTLAVHTEDVNYVVNGNVIKTETCVVKRWKR